jgi:hypothetical protein
MGQYLNLYRLPPEWAVEMLSGRQSIGDLREGNAESPIYMLQSVEEDNTGASRQVVPLDQIDIRFPSGALDWERNQLYVGRYYREVADMLTGSFHGLHQQDSTFEVGLDETDEPLDWAVFGRRICGWRIDLPLRYSTPADLSAITTSLAALTNVDLRSNMHRVAKQHPYDSRQCLMGYSPGEADERLDDFLPNMLANLRAFFQRAKKRREFVVHHIG